MQVTLTDDELYVTLAALERHLKYLIAKGVLFKQKDNTRNIAACTQAIHIIYKALAESKSYNP